MLVVQLEFVMWMRVSKLTDDIYVLKQEMAMEEETHTTEIHNCTGRKIAVRFLKSVTVDLTEDEDGIKEDSYLVKRNISSNKATDIGDGQPDSPPKKMVLFDEEANSTVSDMQDSSGKYKVPYVQKSSSKSNVSL